MNATDKGYLIIADISGYTAFLSQSELEPAAEHLRAFLNILIEQTKPPLIVSRLQGDAVISYAAGGSFLQGQTLVEIVESTYVAFRRALDLAVMNNACDCSACSLIPSLDLKFFVHYGPFLQQQLGSHVELIGPDVNLIHRLTKNSITEKTGIKAYVAYTQAAVESLGIREQASYMTPHEEYYEHVGRVMIYVQDMYALWDEKQAQLRDVVTPDGALLIMEETFPVAQSLMWDHVTRPEYNAILSGSRNAGVSHQSKGRVGLGTIYQCARGNSISQHVVLAWEPLEQYTYESPRTWGFHGRTTIRLTPTEGGTRVSILMSKGIGGSSFLGSVHDFLYRLTASRSVRKGLAELRARISLEEAEGRLAPSATVTLSQDELERGIVAALTH